MNVLPTMAEQATEMLMKEPNAFVKFDEKAKKFTLTSTDPFWRNACHERFPWTKCFDEKNYEKVNPATIAKESDKRNINLFETSDSLRAMLDNSFFEKYDYKNVKEASAFEEYEQDGDFTWR